MPFLGGRGQASRGYFGGGTTPDAPTSLVSTKGNGQISVAFTAPGFDGGLPITTYQYALSTDSYATWTARSAGTTASPLVITGLSNGTSYGVKIRAVNSLGAGVASDAATAVTPSTIPNAPATPIVNPLDTGDTITWSALTGADTGGSAITGYYYKVSTNDGAYGDETFVAAGATLSYATANQYSTSTKKIQVRAENANGTSGFSPVSANTVAWAQDSGQVQQNPTACPPPTCSDCTAPVCASCGVCPACTANCDGCGTSTVTGNRGTSTSTAGTRGAPTLGTSTRTCYRWTRTSVGSTASGYSYAAGSTSACGDYSTCTASTCAPCAGGTACTACEDTCDCTACGTWSGTVNNPGGGPTITLTNGTYPYAYYSTVFPSGWVYSSQDGSTLYYQGQSSGLPCAGGYLGPNDVQGCSQGGNRVVGGDACRYSEFGNPFGG